ncbi:MAG TPA: peptidylprolyl isomerase [Gammaproteobacteria bacterium]|nr:peptidylprolyl isomerase [Gammaproteobacteria bacterium]
MPKLLRDPLVHFMLIGAVIFVVFALRDEASSGPSRRIVVTEAEVESLWQAMSMLYGQAPTEADIRQLLEPRIREEVLYREALALGLDRDDSQIRQRLVEKMTFLTEDLLPAEPPAGAELAAFFEDNADVFAEPARVSLEQIYFSPSEHGQDVEAAAAAALAELRGRDGSGAGSGPAPTRRYDRVTAAELRRELGEEFATAAFELPDDGAWHGPVRSLFGAHLLRVTAIEATRMPALAEVRDRVLEAFTEAQRRAVNEAAYEELRARYDVVIEIPERVPAQPQGE